MAKKRSNGDGSIVKLKSGTWRATIMDGYTADNKRNRISFTAPTKGEVQQKIRNYFAEKDNNEEVQSEENNFEVWANSWYEDHKTQVQKSTYSGYKFSLNVLLDEFSGIPIDSILPMHINRFMNKVHEQGKSHSAISKYRAMLIQIFDYAEYNDAIKRNPARLAKVIKDNDATESSKDAFNDIEYKSLMKKLPDNKIGHSIRLLLVSGIRVQELLSLKKEDISEDGSIVKIRRAVKMVDGKAELGTTKSKLSNRDIPIPSAYRSSAIYLREHSGNAFIWCSGHGNMLYSIGTFRKWYYKEIDKIEGVRRLSPHCCRHTFVSRLEDKGIPMEQIARLVGHSKITTTNIYLHINYETLENAVEVLG